jgi:hypothetical protein
MTFELYTNDPGSNPVRALGIENKIAVLYYNFTYLYIIGENIFKNHNIGPWR